LFSAREERKKGESRHAIPNTGLAKRSLFACPAPPRALEKGGGGEEGRMEEEARGRLLSSVKIVTTVCISILCRATAGRRKRKEGEE